MMEFIGISFLLLLIGIHSEHVENSPTVETKLGTLIGAIKEVNVFGTQMNVERYLGVPYAEPPVGELRFRKPVPKQPFTSPYEAKKRGNACFQIMLLPLPGSTLGEDCLFLNIYVPTVRKGYLPVMLFIHGGGFITGASDTYSPDTIAAHGDVIVVVINYRLSLWGFLTTDDDKALGNYGLWDQHLAIKWVNENIQAFGGDPSRVTLFGESAGAVSVVFQSLFEGNDGLFQRAIAQSGSVSAPLKSPSNVHKKDAEKLGKLVGCNDFDSQALIDCLRKVPGELLNETVNDFNSGLMGFPAPFIPNVDGEFIKEDNNGMLNSDSETTAKGRAFFSSVDFLSGIDAEEGGMMISAPLGTGDLDNFEPNRTFFEETLIPMAVKLSQGENAPDIVKDLVIHEYTDWSDPDDMDKRRHKFAAIYSELFFSVTLIDTVMRHEKLAQGRKGTYMYVFDVDPSSHILPTPSWCTKATHGDDLQYLFFDDSLYMWKLVGREDYVPLPWERDVAKNLIDMWTNFAKTGNPNKPRHVEMFWPRYTADKQEYLQITRDMTSENVKTHLLAREFNLWKNLIPAVTRAVKEADKSKNTRDSGYCEKDGGCQP